MHEDEKDIITVRGRHNWPSILHSLCEQSIFFPGMRARPGSVLSGFLQTLNFCPFDFTKCRENGGSGKDNVSGVV
jgi:hypothetical protein